MREIFQLSILPLLLICVVSCGNEPSNDEVGEEPEPVTNEHFKLPVVPTEINLFGEIIQFDNFDLKERLDKELIVNTHYHSSTIQILKRSNRHFPEIERILKEESMPDDMKYLCVIESALKQATSPSGAKGFWQFMPAAAKENNLLITSEVDERFHVEKSTRAACKYLRNANKKFDDWVMTSASYNCGVGGLQALVNTQGKSNFFELYMNNETTRYIFRIIALKLILEQPKAYGYYPDDMELYEPVETRSIEITETIGSLSVWANEQGSNLRMVKVLNPWLIANSLTISGGRTFTIALPAN
ncbi:MAG: membrane-bound lytic murein transglycosylase D [Crocinitomicaceae bacterium]|jgi:membrane-bound lytic murein transglycosylase D